MPCSWILSGYVSDIRLSISIAEYRYGRIKSPPARTGQET